MARPSAYADPGVYIDEVVVPGGVNPIAPPFVLGIVGTGLRTKRVTNDAIQRGLVSDEALTIQTVTGTVTSISSPASNLVTVTIPGDILLPQMRGATIRLAAPTNAPNAGSFQVYDVPTAGTLRIVNPSGVAEGAVATFEILFYTAVLTNRADNRVANTSVRLGARTLADSQVSFVPAYVLGTEAGPFDLSTNRAFAVEVDNRRGVTIEMLDGTARVHAAHAANGANTFPGPITSPSVPSRIAVTFAASWDGGNVTINGTNAAGATIAETVTAATGVVVTASYFATVTSITKATTGATTNTATIGTYDDVAITGQLCRTYTPLSPAGTAASAATRADVVLAANAALRNHSTYGSNYASTFYDWTTGILAVGTSNVRLLSAVARDALATVFGASGADNRDARSRIRLAATSYRSTGTYTADYVRVRSDVDTLPQTSQGDAQAVVRVGSVAGSATWTQDVDYARLSNTLSWAFATAPSFTTSIGTATGNGYDLSTNTDVAFGLDGADVITFRLTGLASPPLGYANAVSAADTLAAEAALNINAILAASSAYGPRYASAASVVTVAGLDYLVITSPTTGRAGAITFRAPSSLSAMSAVFGLAATALPRTVVGAGSRPADGALYFATYDIERPSADYNAQRRYFTVDRARADLGPASSENPVQMGVEIAFRQGVSSVVVVQVNDASTPGYPTRAEILAALNATTTNDTVTDVVVLSTDLATQLDLKDHVENQSTGRAKHYRRGWYGMPRSTAIGDSDTADTFLYRAVRTLAYAPDSSGRGRAVLVAPPQPSGVSYDVTLEDATTERVSLDSSYLALAWAARSCSFTSPAAELAQSTVVGFNVDDIAEAQLWLPEERALLASNGVFVTTYDGGNFKNLDPVTTEVGNGRKNAFSYVAGSKQKDNLRRKVGASMATNLVGVVPSDLNDFVTDVKLLIADVIRSAVANGECGQYVVPLANGGFQVRDIDIRTDIFVQRDPNDPTTFYFKYWFNLRYAALRFFGEFTVDTPFASAAA